MNKRKTRFGGIHDEAIPRKKARRKAQAFGVPKTAAVTAIIKRNGTESAFLRLPLEIRQRIWAFALGDKLLHVRRVWPWGSNRCDGTVSDSDSDSDSDSFGFSDWDCDSHCDTENKSKWSTTCCISPYTEMKLLERSKRTVEELFDADEAELGLFTDHSRTSLYDNESATEERRNMRRFDLESNPHYRCREMAEESEKSPELREKKVGFLPTQILRACRQIYTEANPIIWKTNTFSFADAKDFKSFMHERTTAQKAAISTLRFDINWTPGVRAFEKWKTHACQLGFIRSLRGLRSLSLYVEQDYAAFAASLERTQPYFEFWDWCFDAMARFRILPLQCVSVVLANSKRAKEVKKLPLSDRVTIAERFREKLLDPEGAKDFERQRVQEAGRRAEGCRHRR